MQIPASSLRVAILGGVEIRFHYSWFLVVVLVTWSFARSIFLPHSGNLYASFVSGAITAVLIYGCLLMHEFGHILVAKYYSLPVKRMYFHFLGAIAVLERITQRPKEEFFIAIAGPCVSFLIAGILKLVSFFIESIGLPALMITVLMFANLWVGVFNLIPFFPMDGGRVLYALAWGFTGDMLSGLNFTAKFGSFLFALGFFSVIIGVITGNMVAFWYLFPLFFIYVMSKNHIKVMIAAIQSKQAL